MPSFPQGAIDVTTAPELDDALSRLSPAHQLAVDVEADAMHAFRARLCFVQVGTEDSVFLLDTLAPGVEAARLAALFADPSRTKVFHAAGGDLQYLAEAGVRVRNLFDTHRAATLLGWPKVGLADLARALLEIELPKEHQQSDFSVRPIPPAMREYIANDVRYLSEIARQVQAACALADIQEEVRLDCDRLADEAAVRPPVAPFEPKLPRGGLTPDQLRLARALALALHQARLRWAEAANVPMGKMLSAAAIHAIALKQPKDKKTLARLEGVRGAFVREHGDDTLALVEAFVQKSSRGELPEVEAPQRRDSRTRKREDALKAWRTTKAQERRVTGSVVLTNPLLSELAAEPPESLDVLSRLPYFGEKRLGLYGAELLALLNQT
ncbi:MAG: ribonuclease D [Myxococcaceae bacterium]